MTDQDLWQQLKTGSKQALEQIYQSHVDALIQYGYKFTLDKQLIEDSIQELFIDLYNNRSKIGNTSSIRPYLLVALRRRVIKALRKTQKRFVDTSPEEVDFEIELSIDELIIQQEISTEKAVRIRQALKKLSPRQREILYLKYFQDISYDDICTIMDISYQSARNLVAKGLTALRKAMLGIGVLLKIGLPLYFLFQ